MDGVFMKKFFILIITILLVVSFFGAAGIWKDKQSLQDSILRLHVVGNSDSEYDQQVKLRLKDKLVEYLQPITDSFSDKEQVMQYIREHLEELRAYADGFLESIGVSERVKVHLRQESFDTREYDTFTLPAGVYDALRIEIGDAEGKNWWCVTFPSLCLPATSREFHDTAVSSGFSETLTNSLTGKKQYRYRFFILDCIGKLENFFAKY